MRWTTDRRGGALQPRDRISIGHRVSYTSQFAVSKIAQTRVGVSMHGLGQWNLWRVRSAGVAGALECWSQCVDSANVFPPRAHIEAGQSKTIRGDPARVFASRIGTCPRSQSAPSWPVRAFHAAGNQLPVEAGVRCAFIGGPARGKGPPSGDRDNRRTMLCSRLAD